MSIILLIDPQIFFFMSSLQIMAGTVILNTFVSVSIYVLTSPTLISIHLAVGKHTTSPPFLIHLTCTNFSAISYTFDMHQLLPHFLFIWYASTFHQFLVHLICINLSPISYSFDTHKFFSNFLHIWYVSTSPPFLIHLTWTKFSAISCSSDMKLNCQQFLVHLICTTCPPFLHLICTCTNLSVISYSQTFHLKIFLHLFLIQWQGHTFSLILVYFLPVTQF